MALCNRRRVRIRNNISSEKHDLRILWNNRNIGLQMLEYTVLRADLLVVIVISNFEKLRLEQIQNSF